LPLILFLVGNFKLFVLIILIPKQFNQFPLKNPLTEDRALQFTPQDIQLTIIFTHHLRYSTLTATFVGSSDGLSARLTRMLGNASDIWHTTTNTANILQLNFMILLFKFEVLRCDEKIFC